MNTKNTLFVGKVLLSFERLPSTNDYARGLLANSVPAEGTAIVADYQSAGRGQIGREWLAEPGKNLLVSIIFYPRFLNGQQHFIFNQSIALAVADTLENLLEHSRPARLKWPNDIYLGDRKTGGILIQANFRKQRFRYAIVGIGLNVNVFQFPADLPNPTSLALAEGKTFNLKDVRETLFAALEHRYLLLRSGHFQAIANGYHNRLYGRNVPSLFERPDKTQFTATIRGVRSDGYLILDTDAGPAAFAMHQVRMLTPGTTTKPPGDLS